MKIESMRRSRLELYIEILQTIGGVRTLHLKDIQNKTSVDLDYLKERMAFLLEQGLVQQKTNANQVAYKTTERGVRVLKYFSEHQQERTGGRQVSA